MSTVKEIYNKNEVKIALIEQCIVNVNDRLSSIDNKLNNFNSHFDVILKKLDEHNNSLSNRLWSNFLWLISFGIGLYGSLFAILGHTLKWF